MCVNANEGGKPPCPPKKHWVRGIDDGGWGMPGVSDFFKKFNEFYMILIINMTPGLVVFTKNDKNRQISLKITNPGHTPTTITNSSNTTFA